MIRNYTIMEYRAMVKTAFEQREKTPSYRIGQALFNLMEQEMSDFSRTLEDHCEWYNETDENLCIEYFHRNFVRNEKLPNAE